MADKKTFTNSDGVTWTYILKPGEHEQVGIWRTEEEYSARALAGGPMLTEDGEGPDKAPAVNIVTTQSLQNDHDYWSYVSIGASPGKVVLPSPAVQRAGWYTPWAATIRDHFPMMFKKPLVIQPAESKPEPAGGES